MFPYAGTYHPTTRMPSAWARSSQSPIFVSSKKSLGLSNRAVARKSVRTPRLFMSAIAVAGFKA
jgi:hypothetical protein